MAVGSKRRAVPLGLALRELRERREWKLVGALARADRPLASAWWVALVLRGGA